MTRVHRPLMFIIPGPLMMRPVHVRSPCPHRGEDLRFREKVSGCPRHAANDISACFACPDGMRRTRGTCSPTLMTPTDATPGCRCA